MHRLTQCSKANTKSVTLCAWGNTNINFSMFQTLESQISICNRNKNFSMFQTSEFVKYQSLLTSEQLYIHNAKCRLSWRKDHMCTRMTHLPGTNDLFPKLSKLPVFKKNPEKLSNTSQTSGYQQNTSD